jgi:hypothetical protein
MSMIVPRNSIAGSGTVPTSATDSFTNGTSKPITITCVCVWSDKKGNETGRTSIQKEILPGETETWDFGNGDPGDHSWTTQFH